MDPQRKRKIRLVVALSAAVLLAASLVYVSFSSSSEAKEPSDLLASSATGSYQVTGTVVPGSVSHAGEELHFRLGNRDDLTENVPVRYSGTVPDPFREGREVIITGDYKSGTLVGERDTLVTKCPSKFSEDAQQNPDQVIITTKQ